MFRNTNRGFTLMEVVIAIALVGIMAATIGPAALRTINRAREEATLKEMDLLKSALLAYYEDVGEFPSESDGLATLVTDGGGAWRGPYFEYDNDSPVLAVTTDAFGGDYIYDLAPNTLPSGSADLIVASTGVNRSRELATGGAAWDLNEDTPHDDLVLTLSIASIERERRGETERELEALAEAARNHFRLNGDFPLQLGDLRGEFIDPGFEEDGFIDGWDLAYFADELGGSDPIFEIWSGGPDRRDDGGAGDDLLLQIDSASLEIAEGEPDWDWSDEGEYSRYLVETAQDSLDTQPGLSLTGVTILSQLLGNLDLSAIFAEDDWGNEIQVDHDARRIYSPGPDGSKTTTGDNIPPGAGG